MLNKMINMYEWIKNENKLYKSFLSPLWGSLGSSKTHGNNGKQKMKSRVYNPSLYTAIYEKSYNVINDVKNVLENMGYKILYMHTDSVFI
jgi:ABC-type uncharacterized transport system substrate-binding protein